jgi:hypothetical protein
MAPVRRVAELLSVQIACADFSVELKTSAWLFEKIDTQDFLGQTVFQTLHPLQLMSEARFQPPSLFFIHSEQVLGLRPS